MIWSKIGMLRELGASLEATGLLLNMIQPCLILLFQLLGGFLADRVGMKKVIVYFIFTSASALMCYICATTQEQMIPIILLGALSPLYTTAFNSMIFKSDFPSISVIVPTKDKRGTLRALLESLKELDYDRNKIEVIIVDGDNSGKVEKITSEYSFIIVKDEGTGLNKARNIGFKKSAHEIVAFTDDDCVVPRDWALRIAESFSDPSIGFVGGSVKGYDKGGFLSTYVDETLFREKIVFKEKIVTKKLKFFRFPAGCNMVFRRKALEKINLFDERIHYGFDDLDPLERIANGGFNMALTPQVIIFHKHRMRLWQILGQNFRYGRGGTLYLLTRKRSQLSLWILIYLFGVFSALMILAYSLIAFLLTGASLSIEVALGLLIAPWLTLMCLYVRRFKSGKDLKRVVLYPLIDILRGLSFAFGALYQLLISLSRVHF